MEDSRKRVRTASGAPAETNQTASRDESQREFNIIDEKSLGITEYTNPDTPGFFGILKQRFVRLCLFKQLTLR